LKADLREGRTGALCMSRERGNLCKGPEAEVSLEFVGGAFRKPEKNIKGNNK
jgi:hypothetical protein